MLLTHADVAGSVRCRPSPTPLTWTSLCWHRRTPMGFPALKYVYCTGMTWHKLRSTALGTFWHTRPTHPMIHSPCSNARRLYSLYIREFRTRITHILSSPPRIPRHHILAHSSVVNASVGCGLPSHVGRIVLSTPGTHSVVLVAMHSGGGSVPGCCTLCDERQSKECIDCVRGPYLFLYLLAVYRALHPLMRQRNRHTIVCK